MRSLTKHLYIIAVLALVAGGYLFYQQFIAHLGGEPIFFISFSNKDLVANQLNGQLVEKGREKLLPIMVMIENHVNARPQAGLNDARVVYEALAEWHITRFLAIYDSGFDLDKIGPIRSARPYFVDIASEYKGLYVHSGGSPTALKQLKNSNLIYNFDEFSKEGYFWRQNSRKAPHNLYTSSKLLLAGQKAIGADSEIKLAAWQFKKDNPAEKPTHTEIKIDYSTTSDNYKVSWIYDSVHNSYKRWQAGQPHVNENDEQIIAKNILVQFVKTKVIDDLGRRKMDLRAGGEALVYQDGIKINGIWKKENGRTRFYDLIGQEVKFNRGQIWVELVPDFMEIK